MNGTLLHRPVARTVRRRCCLCPKPVARVATWSSTEIISWREAAGEHYGFTGLCAAHFAGYARLAHEQGWSIVPDDRALGLRAYEALHPEDGGPMPVAPSAAHHRAGGTP